MKINILDSSVYNLISAGEVVENPASVVKEIVENAIDAGASGIIVKIEEGGIKYIEITDNGYGIPKEEISKTIMPHATAKLETAEDLSYISTLGFRGEALASISAISDFEITSKYIDSDTGAKLTSIAGNVTISDSAAIQGTTVKVSNLFHNTPARYKFLKKPKYEGATVTGLMSHLILSNSNIAFRYYIDNKLIYASSGSGLESAVRAIFGDDDFQNFIPIVESPEKAIKVSGYIGKPEFYKSNRNMQTIIVNGRVINDPAISATILNAYADRIMKHNFPIFVLNILLPFSDVDINVHPNKKEVRFANSRIVYATIYKAVFNTIINFESGMTEKFVETNQEDEELKRELNEKLSRYVSKGPSALREQEGMTYNATSPPRKTSFVKLPDFSDLKIEESGPTFSSISNLTIVSPNEHSGQENMDYVKPIIHTGINDIEKTAILHHSGQASIEIDENTKNYTIIGQMFNTYLIIESNEKIHIIDQHAAHERLLYDKYKSQIDNQCVLSQPLMLPYVHSDDRTNVDKIHELLPELNAIGFEIEEFGADSFKFNAVPMAVSSIRLEIFINEIISLYYSKSIETSSIIREKLVLAACKAAIKGGFPMPYDELEKVIDHFLETGMPLTCPHGRPAYITLTKTEIEKLFRRKL
ncbi:MAG: DNA mismatch repair endonuclease MutL [Christensenellaceae bacterium]|jgi:DNA mismatch repair protein MutL|nr:DNA mismatch repair endonuclease MutL [Christensenellaceae bacterium]